MNILDAIKSGKRFKREHWGNYYKIEEQQIFDQNDVIATDWITEPDPQPKLKAWTNKSSGSVNLFPTELYVNEQLYARVPYLDPPIDKEKVE